MDGNKSKARLIAEFVKSWWGAVTPVLVYFVSDMGLPQDGKAWWMPWIASVVSLVSYVIGRCNAGSIQEISEVRMLRAELDAAKYSAHQHELEEMKWKERYVTRENTRRELTDEGQI